MDMALVRLPRPWWTREASEAKRALDGEPWFKVE
jgi:hypothetical protein